MFNVGRRGYDVTLLVNDDLGNEVVNGVVNGVVIVSTGRKPRNRWIRFFRSSGIMGSCKEN